MAPAPLLAGASEGSASDDDRSGGRNIRIRPPEPRWNANWRPLNGRPRALARLLAAD